MKIPIRILMERYQNHLYRIAFSICQNREDAEDVVQDDLPVVVGYYLMQTDVSGDDQILRKVTAEEGYVAGLCSGAIGMVDNR